MCSVTEGMRKKRDASTQVAQNRIRIRSPRLLAHGPCCWLLLVQISSLSCGSVEATNGEDKHVKAESHCFDSERNQLVRRSMCHCCFYEDPFGTGFHSNTTAYCGSKKQCDYLQRQQHRAKRSSSLHPIVGMSILLATGMLGISVKRAHRSYMTSKRVERLKMRQVEISKRLDAKFPPIEFGKVDDLECQRDEDEVCCVCLDELEGALVRKLHCSHVLHKDCFDRWCLHLSDTDRGQAHKKPEESLWVCPLCKRPAMLDLEQPGSIPRSISRGSADPQLQSQASDGCPALCMHTGGLNISQEAGDLPTLLSTDRHVITLGSPVAHKVSVLVPEYDSRQSSPEVVSNV